MAKVVFSRMHRMRFLYAAACLFIMPAVRCAAQAGVAGKTAPYYLVKTAEGKTINVAAQKGKVVFLNFWALSCIPCKEELPGIDALRDHYQNDTNVLIIPVDLDKNAGSLKYMQAHHLSLAIYTSASAVPEALFRGMMPTTVIINKNGEIARYKEGKGDYGSSDFFNFIDGLEK